MPHTYQGSCLCAAVSYQLLTAPKALTHCHCSQCRKGQGAAFASYASVPRNALKVLTGADTISTYHSSPSVQREFCARCGSNLFWSRAEGEFSDWVSVALATLDTPFTPHSQKHIYLDAKAPWYTPVEPSAPGA